MAKTELFSPEWFREAALRLEPHLRAAPVEDLSPSARYLRDVLDQADQHPDNVTDLATYRRRQAQHRR